MKTVLWVHGFPLSPAVFDEQIVIEGVRHIVPALPGFDGAPPPDGDPTMEDYARYVLAELDRNGVERATFAGLSMGGYVCFSAMRLAPERFEGLILIDTRETPDSAEARKGRFTMMGRVRMQGNAPLVESMLPKMLTAAAPGELRQRVRWIMESASNAGVVAALRAMANRGDSSDLLPSIAVPTLVVVGEEDAITPPEDAGRMAAAIPGARLVRIAGAAHLSNLEQPEAFNAAVVAFLAAG